MIVALFWLTIHMEQEDCFPIIHQHHNAKWGQRDVGGVVMCYRDEVISGVKHTWVVIYTASDRDGGMSSACTVLTQYVQMYIHRVRVFI